MQDAQIREAQVHVNASGKWFLTVDVTGLPEIAEPVRPVVRISSGGITVDRGLHGDVRTAALSEDFTDRLLAAGSVWVFECDAKGPRLDYQARVIREGDIT